MMLFANQGTAHLVRVSFEEAGRGRARGVGALHAAPDQDGLRVGELDVYLVLLNTWKLAVQLKVGIVLLQVELGGEGLDLAECASSATVLALVLVVPTVRLRLL